VIVSLMRYHILSETNTVQNMYKILGEQHKHSVERVSLSKRHVSTSSHRHRKVTYSHHDVAKKMLT
jgi:hypothetical protein